MYMYLYVYTCRRMPYTSWKTTHVSKETYEHQKSPTYIKRLPDYIHAQKNAYPRLYGRMQYTSYKTTHVSKETYEHQKRPIHIKRDLSISRDLLSTHKHV